jgi:hypothetical protein
MKSVDFNGVIASFFIANFTFIACGYAQNLPEKKNPVCIAAKDVAPVQLYGAWVVQWTPPALKDGVNLLSAPLSSHLPANTTITFKVNPDYPDSLVATMPMAGKRHLLAGDIEDGLLTLEESADGTNIHANWALQVVLGSCAKELKGTWISAGDGGERGVVLRRVAGW